jgi:transposase InsO family protein
MAGKGRYSGRHMMVYTTILPGAIGIARWANKVNQLTPDAKKRLKILDWYRAHGKNISLTARHFGLRRQTITEWHKRFDQRGVLGLIEKSRRPKNVRTPETSWKIQSEVVRLRKKYPVWSKHKIHALLLEQGIKTSESTVGRILKRRGLIDKKKSLKRKRAALSPKARFPYGLRISRPGDLIQIDTKYIMLIGGRKLYQFTAIDVLTKWRVLRVYPSQSSRNGKEFLKECIKSFPFPIQAIQTDNGAEFLKEFQLFCKEKNLPHYYIYPRTPKQNSYVERSHGSDQKEFYEQGNVYSDRGIMNKKLISWEHVWNTIRPHESLNQISPKAYLAKWQYGRLPTRDTITLQT